MNYTDILIEELLEESAKTDFIEKFGEDTFDKFEKAKQRIKNSGKSVDYQQYLAMSKEELIDFIASFYDDVKDAQKKRIIKGVDKEIRGKYKYLGEKDGYKVYQPLDVQASMDLGVNTGWCTTGRYGHAGHPEYTPSIGDAKEHWNRYSLLGVRFFYFLNPDTMYGEYALALYPRTITVNREFSKDKDKVTEDFYLSSTNFELFNAKDDLDFSAVTKLPLDLIPEKVRVNIVHADENGLIIGNKGSLLKLSKGSLAKSVVIPDHVVSIGAGAFRGNLNIESVVIPKGVKSIGAEAFLSCKNLTSVTFEEGSQLTRISKEAFYNCTSLNSIKLPVGVTDIGECAFQYCIKLTSINIPDGVTDLDACVFWDCRDLVSITLPKNLVRIGPSAFRECESLTSIIVPDGLKVIDRVAFMDCTGLKSITLPRSLTALACTTFKDDNIKEINYLGTMKEWEALTKAEDNFYLEGTEGIKVLDGYIDCITGELTLDADKH